MPDSPYRALIDATERDVRLVLVDGAPVAGDVDAMQTAGATAIARVHSVAGRYTKALPPGPDAAVPPLSRDVNQARAGGNPFAGFHDRWYAGR